MIRHIKKSDIPWICEIYNYYIKNTTITFEEEEIDELEMSERINDITKKYPWIVYEENKKTVGYSFASRWKARTAYRYSAESTVYLNRDFIGKGIGRKLLSSLITEVKTENIHSLIGGIALPNESSIELYEKLGFKKIAHFSEVGFKFGKWIDVGYWEKIN